MAIRNLPRAFRVMPREGVAAAFNGGEGLEAKLNKKDPLKEKDALRIRRDEVGKELEDLKTIKSDIEKAVAGAEAALSAPVDFSAEDRFFRGKDPLGSAEAHTEYMSQLSKEVLKVKQETSDISQRITALQAELTQLDAQLDGLI